MDGSIDSYQNTTEGTEVSFMCNPMFVPAGRMTAVCGTNRRWNPDPAGLVCTCEYSSTVCSYVKVACTHVPIRI